MQNHTLVKFPCFPTNLSCCIVVGFFWLQSVLSTKIILPLQGQCGVGKVGQMPQLHNPRRPTPPPCRTSQVCPCSIATLFAFAFVTLWPPLLWWPQFKSNCLVKIYSEKKVRAKGGRMIIREVQTKDRRKVEWGSLGQPSAFSYSDTSTKLWCWADRDCKAHKMSPSWCRQKKRLKWKDAFLHFHYPSKNQINCPACYFRLLVSWFLNYFCVNKPWQSVNRSGNGNFMLPCYFNRDKQIDCSLELISIYDMSSTNRVESFFMQRTCSVLCCRKHLLLILISERFAKSDQLHNEHEESTWFLFNFVNPLSTRSTVHHNSVFASPRAGDAWSNTRTKNFPGPLLPSWTTCTAAHCSCTRLWIWCLLRKYERPKTSAMPVFSWTAQTERVLDFPKKKKTKGPKPESQSQFLRSCESRSSHILTVVLMVMNLLSRALEASAKATSTFRNTAVSPQSSILLRLSVRIGTNYEAIPTALQSCCTHRCGLQAIRSNFTNISLQAKSASGWVQCWTTRSTCFPWVCKGHGPLRKQYQCFGRQDWCDFSSRKKATDVRTRRTCEPRIHLLTLLVQKFNAQACAKLWKICPGKPRCLVIRVLLRAVRPIQTWARHFMSQQGHQGTLENSSTEGRKGRVEEEGRKTWTICYWEPGCSWRQKLQQALSPAARVSQTLIIKQLELWVPGKTTNGFGFTNTPL